MPLTVNVGLSRKASKDYQSTGVSINITAELDQSLLARPEELQAQIDGLYAQAEQALTRQTDASSPASGTTRRSVTPSPNRNGRNGGSNNATGMTRSQRRAIESIARRLKIAPAVEIDHVFGWLFDELTLPQASQVIDHLKGCQPAPGGSGRR